MNSLPGDAAQELLGAQATPPRSINSEIKLGLDKPFLTRYWDWLHNASPGISAIRCRAVRASARSSAPTCR